MVKVDKCLFFPAQVKTELTYGSGTRNGKVHFSDPATCRHCTTFETAQIVSWNILNLPCQHPVCGVIAKVDNAHRWKINFGNLNNLSLDLSHLPGIPATCNYLTLTRQQLKRRVGPGPPSPLPPPPSSHSHRQRHKHGDVLPPRWACSHAGAHGGHSRLDELHAAASRRFCSVLQLACLHRRCLAPGTWRTPTPPRPAPRPPLYPRPRLGRVAWRGLACAPRRITRRILKLRAVPSATVLHLRTTTSQRCEAVPRRARI